MNKSDIALELARKVLDLLEGTRPEFIRFHKIMEAKVAALLRPQMCPDEQIQRERDAAIGILARLPWCECGHQHRGSLVCMGCDCDEQIPMSREMLVEKITAMAALPSAPSSLESSNQK